MNKYWLIHITTLFALTFSVNVLSQQPEPPEHLPAALVTESAVEDRTVLLTVGDRTYRVNNDTEVYDLRDAKSDTPWYIIGTTVKVRDIGELDRKGYLIANEVWVIQQDPQPSPSRPSAR